MRIYTLLLMTQLGVCKLCVCVALTHWVITGKALAVIIME